ncbi:MAG: molecular chaperone DnaJ [Pirellulales bacterium]
MAGKRDYYEVLGVKRNATDKQIADAYRKLAIKFHPDKNPGDEEAIVMFKEAAEAFEVLGDGERRSQYDRYGHAAFSSGAGGRGFADVNDIFAAFGDIFGESGFGDLFGGGGRRRRGSRGADVRSDVTLDLMQAARGATVTVEFQRHEICTDCDGNGAKPGSQRSKCSYCGGRGQVIQSTGIFRVQTTCPSCHGSGTVIKEPCTSCRASGFVLKHVRREVQIPAGIDDQMRVRLPGEGEPSPSGGPRGDCYCFITVKEHSLFQRDGQHLIVRVPIAYSQAALGSKIEVPTLDGPDELKIPPGTQSGAVFKLRGKGMPSPRGRGVGDLLVQVNIEVPKTLNETQEALLRQLAEQDHVEVSPHRKSFFDKVREFFGEPTA